MRAVWRHIHSITTGRLLEKKTIVCLSMSESAMLAVHEEVTALKFKRKRMLQRGDSDSRRDAEEITHRIKAITMRAVLDMYRNNHAS